ncbi:MAG: glycine cleavage T C-terminal barrel domain-containing protein [Candidatus Dormibacteraceae bacterium]
MVGKVTSGTFSFSLNKGIGMAMIDEQMIGPEKRLELESHGRPGYCQIVELPHLSRRRPNR